MSRFEVAVDNYYKKPELSTAELLRNLVCNMQNDTWGENEEDFCSDDWIQWVGHVENDRCYDCNYALFVYRLLAHGYLGNIKSLLSLIKKHFSQQIQKVSSPLVGNLSQEKT